MSIEITDWLRALGLEQYEPAFRANDVDAEILPKLTADDLISIGVTSVGHRRKLLEAISTLNAATAATKLTAVPNNAAALGEAERRQLTVMFCDLGDSTALSSQLDPEDYREVISAYHRTVASSVARFDGFVAKYMGDGILIYFGYPRAHEDDAERAVRAGLDAIAAISRLDIKAVKLKARVGAATGLVIVGDMIGEGSAQEQSVAGEIPNLAARLQALAGPDAVVISQGTRQLLGDLFEYRDLGPVAVKGISTPVAAWHVLRPSVVASRFEALHGVVRGHLIGRNEEIDRCCVAGHAPRLHRVPCLTVVKVGTVILDEVVMCEDGRLGCECRGFRGVDRFQSDGRREASIAPCPEPRGAEQRAWKASGRLLSPKRPHLELFWRRCLRQRPGLGHLDDPK